MASFNSVNVPVVLVDTILSSFSIFKTFSFEFSSKIISSFSSILIISVPLSSAALTAEMAIRPMTIIRNR